MTGRQKLILVLMGLLDLAVVLALGSVVLLSQQRQHPPDSGSAVDATCATALRQKLPPTWQPLVSGGPTVLTIALSPEAGDGQAFWKVLDALKVSAPLSCTVPQTITLLITGADAGDVAQIGGDDFRAWQQGQLSDAELSRRARYRHLTRHP